MLRKTLLALSMFAVLAVGASAAKADHCYRPYGHHGSRYSSHSMYYRGGYGHSHLGYYPPSIAPRPAYPYSRGRYYSHAPAPSRGGVYFSIGF